MHNSTGGAPLELDHAFAALRGERTGVLSSHYEETKRADAAAFSELCRFLSGLEGVEETLLAVQVENEPGIMNGPPRDHSARAEEEFAAPLPGALAEWLAAHPDTPAFCSRRWGGTARADTACSALRA